MKDTVFNHVAGVSFATLAGFDAQGRALVALPDGAQMPARALVALDAALIGAELAVTPVADGAGLLILGLLDPPRPERHVIEAARELVLRCGETSVTLTSDGRLTLRGKQLLSRAEGANRVQGASVKLN
ncbi:hypothetical protein KO516_03315 [Citreicella sp. C3M06]|uniref:DUF6484 domain-containing protein n=1 Tax=Roseobacteraceae TaxID=2854170 RepID=UPI001C085239|nr:MULTISPECIES: DUF6484 domain-containing protein [Roseobacteraceae]MBU2959869.1 hypothetical protein [Citreicella sp. C3M06]MDO6587952.1 DUF6484 domain-containing protein [Salipiger sp. 1_MG-2023]